MSKIKQLFQKWLMAGLIACGPVTCLQHWNNTVEIEHFRGGELIGVYETKNGIVDVGINSLLDVTFRNQTQIATWYMGLVDNAGYSAFNAGDTMASHSGWAEFAGYSESNRPTWTPSAAATRAITNGTAVEFTINTSGTMRGIFMTSNNTKSGSTGTLWATAAFSVTVPVTNGDVLKVTYTISG